MIDAALQDEIRTAYQQLTDSLNLVPRWGQRQMIAEVANALADAEVAERYEAIVDLVPDSLRVDLILVIAGLRSEAVDIPEREIVMEETTTTRPPVDPDQTSADAQTTTKRVDVDPEVLEALDTEPDAEGRPIPLLPVERIAAYVDEVCRGTSNNPGPPPGTVVSGPDT